MPVKMQLEVIVLVLAWCRPAHEPDRSQARFDSRDLEEQTTGVECRKDGGVLDEIPGAYKDIDEVMRNQSDLVEVVHTLKQIVCIKG